MLVGATLFVPRIDMFADYYDCCLFVKKKASFFMLIHYTGMPNCFYMRQLFHSGNKAAF